MERSGAKVRIISAASSNKPDLTLRIVDLPDSPAPSSRSLTSLACRLSSSLMSLSSSLLLATSEEPALIPSVAVVADEQQAPISGCEDCWDAAAAVELDKGRPRALRIGRHFQGLPLSFRTCPNCSAPTRECNAHDTKSQRGPGKGRGSLLFHRVELDQ